MLAAVAGCSQAPIHAPVDFAGAKSVALVIPDGIARRVVAADVADLDDSALKEPIVAGTELYLFDRDRAELRLGSAPAVVEASACPLDELSTSRAKRALCLEGEAFVPCPVLPERLLAREPYMGQACFQWSVDDLGLLEFDIASGIQPAKMLIPLGPGQMLMGQILEGDTLINVVDISGPFVAVNGGLVARLAGVWTAGTARDETSVWLADPEGRLVKLDTESGALEPVTGPSPGGAVISLARSPADHESVLATTDRCSVLRRDADQWYEIGTPVDLNNFPASERIPCTPQVTWVSADEALAVGIATGPRPRNTALLNAQRRRLFRIHGNVPVPDNLPWPEALPEGFLTGVTAYLTPGGARVELAVGHASDEISMYTGKQKLWFVNDPRRGEAWIRIDDPNTDARVPLLRLIPWSDGALGVGGYFQAFSDAHWTRDPLAALSIQTDSGLLRDRVLDLVEDDGRGGFIAASSSGDTDRERFVWRQRR